MTLAELIAAVGRERYDAARGWAWRTAEGTGGRPEPGPWPDDLGMVPHELADLWDDTSSSLESRLDLALRVYGEMPCYGNLMYLKHHYAGFGPNVEPAMWICFRAALDDDDARLADPVGYALWCDYFEDPDTVERAWFETTRQDVGTSTLRLRRVLRLAGPVPWMRKLDLFDELIDDVTWHPFIYAALRGSAFDLFGKLEIDTARQYLGRLVLTHDTAETEELHARLEDLASARDDEESRTSS